MKLNAIVMLAVVCFWLFFQFYFGLVDFLWREKHFQRVIKKYLFKRWQRKKIVSSAKSRYSMIIISAEMSKEKEAVQLVTREFADNTQSKWTNDENTPKKKKRWFSSTCNCQQENCELKEIMVTPTLFHNNIQRKSKIPKTEWIGEFRIQNSRGNPMQKEPKKCLPELIKATTLATRFKCSRTNSFRLKRVYHRHYRLSCINRNLVGIFVVKFFVILEIKWYSPVLSASEFLFVARCVSPEPSCIHMQQTKRYSAILSSKCNQSKTTQIQKPSHHVRFLLHSKTEGNRIATEKIPFHEIPFKFILNRSQNWLISRRTWKRKQKNAVHRFSYIFAFPKPFCCTLCFICVRFCCCCCGGLFICFRYIFLPKLWTQQFFFSVISATMRE